MNKYTTYCWKFYTYSKKVQDVLFDIKETT